MITTLNQTFKKSNDRFTVGWTGYGDDILTPQELVPTPGPGQRLIIDSITYQVAFVELPAVDLSAPQLDSLDFFGTLSTSASAELMMAVDAGLASPVPLWTSLGVQLDGASGSRTIAFGDAGLPVPQDLPLLIAVSAVGGLAADTYAAVYTVLVIGRYEQVTPGLPADYAFLADGTGMTVPKFGLGLIASDSFVLSVGLVAPSTGAVAADPLTVLDLDALAAAIPLPAGTSIIVQEVTVTGASGTTGPVTGLQAPEGLAQLVLVAQRGSPLATVAKWIVPAAGEGKVDALMALGTGVQLFPGDSLAIDLAAAADSVPGEEVTALYTIRGVFSPNSDASLASDYVTGP
jgi:hypothetical protein